MEPRWDRVKQLFSSAVELPREARDAFLDENCRGDAQLRLQVVELLQAHGELATLGGEPPAPDAGAPPEVERFRILEEIGQGGMGTVYLAEQLEPVQRRVALKVVKRGMDTREVVRRFELERQTLALMEHPNVARVLDAGETHDGRPFFAMEYVPGVPLHAFCDAERLDLETRLRRFVEVCRGVHHAHSKGIVHRDLKPSNVLAHRGPEGAVVKIIDFGIAKALQSPVDQASLLTQVGHLVGTPAYISPEQATRSRDVDTRSDIYSLGVLLYELITGQLPFALNDLLDSGGLTAVLDALSEKDPPRPSTRFAATEERTRLRLASSRATQPRELVSRLRGDLDWITMRCLEKEPARRYQSAWGLAADIERFLADEPVLAAPPALGYRLRKTWRRNRGALLATAAIFVSLVVGLAAALHQAGVARDRAEEARAAFEREREARRRADGHRLSAQAIALAGENPTTALLLAIEGAERAPGEDATQALYEALEHHRELASYTGHDGPVERFVVAPGGELGLSCDWTGEVLGWDLVAGTVLWRNDEHKGVIEDVEFDPDGMRGYSAGRDGTARIWEPRTGAVLGRLPHPATVNRLFALAGSRLVTTCSDGRVRLWDTERSEVLAVLGQHAAPATLVDVSEAAGLVATVDGKYGYRLGRLDGSSSRTIPVDAGAPPEIYNLEQWYRPFVGFDASGTRLVTRARNGALEVWDTQSLERVRRDAEPGFVSNVARSEDRRWLYLWNRRGGGRCVDLATGALRSRLSELDPGERASGTFSPSGRWLVTSAMGREPRVWDAATGRELAELRGHHSPPNAVEFARDGSRIYTGGMDGVVRVFSTSVLDERRAPFESGEPVLALSEDAQLAMTVRSAGSAPTRLACIDTRSGEIASDLGRARVLGARVALDPPARRIAAHWKAGAEDWRLAVLDRASGDELWSIAVPALQELEFTGDGNWLWTRIRNEFVAWSAADGSVRARFPVEGGFQFGDLDAGGTRVATADGGPGTIRIWNAADGALLARFGDAGGWMFDVGFDPSGRYVAGFSNDSSVRVWDLQTGELRHRFESLPLSDHGRLRWNHRGDALLAATPRLLVVLDVKNGRRLVQWDADEDFSIATCAFAPDDLHIVSANRLGLVRRLTLDPLARARQLAPRELTAAEMERYELGTPEERRDRARAEREALRSPRLLRSAALTVLREDGDCDGALDLLDRAVALRPVQPSEYHLIRAVVLSLRVGQLRARGANAAADRDAAFESLARAVRMGYRDRASLENSERLAPLRDDPRFQELIESMR